MTERLRVLVAEDEPLARAGVVGLVGADPDLVVVGECGDGPAAVAAIARLRPDLVLLDIQMPALDGFGVIREVGPERMPPVVFITAYDQYAVRAFEVHALDYLLKPFDDDRFAVAMARAKAAVRGAGETGGLDDLRRRLMALLGDAPAGPVGEPWLTRIVVRKAGTNLVVPVEEIDWIEAADYCARLHAKGKVHVIRESLGRLEQRLDPARFFRAHRSGIVNLDRVREIQPGGEGDWSLVLHDGSRLRLSRSRRAALEQRLGQPL